MVATCQPRKMPRCNCGTPVGVDRVCLACHKPICVKCLVIIRQDGNLYYHAECAPKPQIYTDLRHKDDDS